MQQIIINQVNEGNQASRTEASALQSVSGGRFFNSFVESQRIGYTKPDGTSRKKGITAEGAANLRAETIQILNHCNPHDAVSNPETTHLVIGYVQSGKTMSFTGLTALALDNGYRVVVYLAGTKLNLLEQTANRLEKDLVKANSGNRDFFRIHKDPSVSDANNIISHLKLSTKPIILIPVLKHYEHINRLTDIFKTTAFTNLMENETVLIIDDEADQASLNSFGRKNSKNDDQDEDKVSSTYAAILKLRSTLPGNTYIQYTATPQANILISMQDLLSPKSHTILTPGEGYIGGKLFFGKGPHNDLFNGGLILDIPADQVFHKKKLPLKQMPKSLSDALIFHIIAVAIVVKYLKVEDVNFLSMMVHVDNEKKWNKTFKDWIEKAIKNWSLAFDKPDGHEDKEDLLRRFREIYPLAVRFYSDEDGISFDAIKPFFADIINDTKVYLVNTDKEAETNIEWDKYTLHVLVGAEMLNRGFTVENLATTYMPRYSLSATNADTIQQRCRFFGYKQDYIKSCRVFLPQQSIVHYIDYVEHEEELRQTLGSCDTLEAAERKLLLSDKLRPTRLNVLPINVVKQKFNGISSMRAYDSKTTIDNNDRVVAEFLHSHSANLGEIVMGGDDLSNKHRGFRLPIDDAIRFLSDFQFRNPSDAMRKAATIRYIRYLSNIEDKPLQFVYFMQMAYQMEDSPDGLRKRPLDMERNQLSTSLFQGRSNGYDGDGAMVGQDSITIQLHHIQFKNERLPLGFPRKAYTLAINYPPQLQVVYYAHADKDLDGELDSNT